jgi:hypothetical protein
MHIDIFDFVRIVQIALTGDPKGIKTLQELIRARLPGADDIQQIRIKNYPVQVTRDGPVAMPSEVVMTLPMRPRS